MSSTYDHSEVSDLLRDYTTIHDIKAFKAYIELPLRYREDEYFNMDNRMEWVVLARYYQYLCDTGEIEVKRRARNEKLIGRSTADRDEYEMLVREAEEQNDHVPGATHIQNLTRFLTIDNDIANYNEVQDEYDRLVHEAEQQPLSPEREHSNEVEDISNTVTGVEDSGTDGNNDGYIDGNDHNDFDQYFEYSDDEYYCLCEGRFGYDSEGEIRHKDEECPHF